MGKVFQVFQQQNWVRAGEHFALRVGSLLFSMVSAHAIFWFYDSLAKVDNSDPIQKYVPYVIAGGFGLLGYFVSRGLVYRMMHKERIGSTSPSAPCLNLSRSSVTSRRP